MDQGTQQNNKNTQTDKSPIRPKRYWFNWIYILFFIIIVLFMFNNSGSGVREISWQEFENNMLSQNEVAEIVVVNKELANIYIKEDKLDLPKYKEISKKLLYSKLNPHYKLRIGSVETFENKIDKAQQEFSLEEKIDIRYSNQTDWIIILSWIIPIVLLLFFWIIIIKGIGKSSRGGIGGTMFNFGKSTARLIDIDKRSTVTFNDVAGLKEAKVEVKEIVDFLKNPEYYTKLGAKIPKGIVSRTTRYR